MLGRVLQIRKAFILRCIHGITDGDGEIIGRRGLEQSLNAQSSGVVDVSKVYGTRHAQTLQHINQRSIVVRLV